MELKVDSISKARKLIQEDWPTHIISIVNEAGGEFAATVIDRQHDDHYIFSFHDVENDEVTDYVVPTRKDVADILETAKMVPQDGRLLVHCTAGKSRSTAAAIGILIQNGMAAQEAFDWMKAHRPAMFPNRLMIEYVDEILGLNGELIDIVKTYYMDKLLLFPKLVEINRGGYNR
jgi:predicted protein tyrosine phosphatase